MALNTTAGNFSTPILIADDVQVPGGSYPAAYTKEGGVNVPVVLELQSTTGAFLGPRMSEAERDALTPLVAGMEVYVTDGGAPGKYIRGSGTWNLVAGSGDLNNVTVDQDDTKEEFVVPIWSGSSSEIMSTDLTIENSDQLIGISYVTTKLSPPTNFPNYGINPSGPFVSTEGIGSDAIGSMTLWAGGAIQANVMGGSNTSNILRILGGNPGNPVTLEAFSTVDADVSIKLSPQALGTVDIFGGDGTNYLSLVGSSTGDPVSITAYGMDADVDIEITPRGDGQLLNGANGSALNPAYSFVPGSGNGMYNIGSQEIGFASDGALQLSVFGTSSSVNYLTIGGSTANNSIPITANGTDTNISLRLTPKGTGQVRSSTPGSSSLPAYSFTSRIGDGMYSVLNGTLGFSAQGLRQVEIFGTGDGTNYLVFSGNSSGNNPHISATGSDTDVSLTIATKGAGQILSESSGIDTSPIYSFENSSGDGMYNVTPGLLGFAVGSAHQIEIRNSGDSTNYLTLGGSATGAPIEMIANGSDTDIAIQLSPKGAGQVLNNPGSEAAPAYSFTSTPGNGIYNIDAQSFGFSAGGALQAAVLNLGDGTNNLVFSGSVTGEAPAILATGSDTDVSFFLATTGEGFFGLTSVDGENALVVSNFETGQAVQIAAVGDDTDVTLELYTQGAGDVLISNPNANLGVGISSFAPGSTATVSITSGTPPGASIGDTIQLYSTDVSAGNTTLGLWTEGTPVSATVSVVPTDNIAVVINGTTYYLMAKTIV